MIRIIILLLFGLIFLELSAQENIRFHHYRMSDGLSNNVIRCLFQDSKGFIWIGTDEGLNRFDGLEFRHYLKDENDPSSISGNVIHDIAEDQFRNLWIATKDGGLCCYIRLSGKFEKYIFPERSIGNNQLDNILDISVRNGNEIWVGFERSPLFHFEIGKKGDYHAPDSISIYRERFYDIFTSRDQTLYLGQIIYGLTIWDGKDWSLVNKPGVFPAPGSIISAIYEDNEGMIWQGGWDNGLHKYDPKSKKYSTAFLIDNNQVVYDAEEIQALNQNGDYIWIGTRYGGIWTFNKNTNESYQHQALAYDEFSLCSNSVLSMLNDNEGRIWIGTSNGLSIYDPLKYQFEVVYPSGSEVDAKADENITCFFQEKNLLILGTTKGLWFKNEASDHFEFIALKEKSENLKVYSIAKTTNGDLILGTNKTAYLFDIGNFGLRRMNTIHNIFGSYKSGFHNLNSSRVSSITEFDYKGRKLLAISVYGGGLAYLDVNNLSGFLHYPTVDSIVQSLSINSEYLVRKVYTDSKNRLWVAGAVVGLHFDFKIRNEDLFEKCMINFGRGEYHASYPNDSLLVNFRSNFAGELPPAADAFDIIELEDGRFLCSTYGKGLWEIDQNLESVKPIPSLHQSLEGLAIDDDKNIWIIASGGFDKYDQEKKTWQRYDYRDGFPASGVSGYFHKDNQGRLYAGGAGYFVRFDPSSIATNNRAPEVVFTGFSIFNQPSEYLLNQDEIILDYNQSNVAFTFSALNFTNPEMNQYAYRLLGFEDEWVYSGTINFARYPSLSGGDYTFEVKAANNHGVWNEKKLSIPLRIIPPFWQRKWFAPLLIGIAFIFGLIVYHIRMSQIKKNQLGRLRVEIEAQEKERKRLAEDLHDDLGTKMSTLKLYMNTLNQYMSHNDKLSAIGNSAQLLLDDSIRDLRSLLLNLSPQNVAKFGVFRSVHELVLRLEQTGLIQVNYECSVVNERFDPKNELALYRIIQELINNSIKHSDCNEIDLAIHKFDGMYTLEYADNGKGLNMENSPLNIGFGLKNIENRCQIAGGKIVWNGLDKQGFNVQISIPSLKVTNNE